MIYLAHLLLFCLVIDKSSAIKWDFTLISRLCLCSHVYLWTFQFVKMYFHPGASNADQTSNQTVESLSTRTGGDHSDNLLGMVMWQTLPRRNMDPQECDNFFTQNTLACFKTKQYGGFIHQHTSITIVITVLVVIGSFIALHMVVVVILAITSMIGFAAIIIVAVDLSFLAAAGHTIIIRGCAPFTSEVILSPLLVLSMQSKTTKIENPKDIKPQRHDTTKT